MRELKSETILMYYKNANKFEGLDLSKEDDDKTK